MSIQPINIPPPVIESEKTRSNVSREIKQAVPAKDQVSEPVKSSGSDPQVKLENIVEKVTELSRQFNTELSFSIDKELDMIIVTISKSDTEPGGAQEVVRQIPPKEMLDLARRLQALEDGGKAEGLILGLEG